MIDKNSHLQRISRTLLLACAVLSASLFLPGPVNAQKQQDTRGAGLIHPDQKVALVIGNADYNNRIGKLNNPINDATDMAAALKRLGFTLVGGKAHLNLNKREMLELIREFGDRISKGGIGLFYFAGHGVQIDRINYLIPITDLIQNQRHAKSEGVSVEDVFDEMRYANNGLNILIIDACRNNNLPKDDRNPTNGLGEPKSKPSGTLIAFAAADGQTADENPNGRNGLFTQELLRHLETPNLRVDDIFRLTRREVKRLSHGTQEPFVYESLDAPFFLNTGESVSSPWSRISGLAKGHLKYDYVGHFSDGLALIRLGKKWGFINNSGNVVVPPKYDNAYTFSEGLAAVSSNEKWGYIDKTGKEIVRPKYDEVFPFSEGLAQVKLNEKWGYIDTTGRVVIPLKYDEVYSFSEGLAVVKLNDKYGFTDKTGKIVIPTIYYYASNFSGGLAAVGSDDTGVNYIDKSGNVAMPSGHDNAAAFSEGLAEVGNEYDHRPFGENGFEIIYKWGFINRRGEEITEIKYDETAAFSEGLAVVVKDGKQGFIDRNGREVIPLKYDADECGCGCSSFLEGLAKVNLNGKVGFIDAGGREVIPVKYDGFWNNAFRKEGFIGVELNGRKGFVDIYGNEYFDF